ncbi:putative SKP1/BTB/POZ domain superfamily, NPH3 domain, NPH3/RPT2-like family protein [Helianthus annuus]|uniref:Putative phototropic-responsive NPH3 family protein n=1 Tax=Helianthus annuus TaxID=4232 RepID=A0A251T5L0_HELAN|nr:BTB/POZ domain-containing protein At1g67900 [Helianthus annuus]KAF5779836.1 putative SKP1/BTB/POZ domain superfamily, NPH3 domain-containing protein [Helianthus annuus]KAJ0506995.1 putative SKP1/BTB/POZ domain superfamily, NPH3 domain, NPH3/RPT2-like family protein [Helianthus annuus]KAJ0676625.1 putative SKP1/BTB/POZ domain superfamily, NPH3 domain, NPH3/RPT2-like family protein [Helianthus annuus]KAJ0868514.1 putative SKP1/BTB/POZ domain superfamily, NPH3 domain, NPH3/RPT2-like family prot
MKFMKLGSRPDTFYNSESVRSVSSEVSSDLVVQVNGTRYLLHKFPLLSKCLRLQKLCSESPESTQHQIIQLPDFPGGTESFELCAKFCYGITITLSAYNIVSARCAAEYLQMTEEVEKGNLVYKLDVFLNSCILNGWKDSIITLQTTKAFQLWSEDLGITSRCIEAIAAKVLSNPLKVSLSHSYSRRGRDRDDISVNGSKTNTSKGWWAEDLSELGIDLYWRTMIALKSGGKVPANLVGDALRIYASKWLPNISRNPENGETTTNSSSKSRLLLESVISLLPTERASVSCSFLLKLLKAANILRASSSSKSELARRIGIQLDEATVSDLLIPSTSNDMTYDVEVVFTILEQFMLQSQSPPTSPVHVKGRFERHRRSRSANNGDFELQESRRSSTSSHSSKIKVAKLVDGYLKEIGKDVNLPLSKFTALAEAIPDFARLDHDDLYRAIDIYLKSHPNLNKTERKRLCRTLDCKKLSMEVCMHAAQNELLPLRVVVQVLFFEQARAAMAGGQLTDLPSNIKALLAAQDDASRPPGSLSTNRSMVQPEDQWSVSGLKSPSSNISTLRMKLAENDDLDENFHDGISKTHSSKVKQLCSLPTRPKRMFSKLWSTNNRSASEKS